MQFKLFYIFQNKGIFTLSSSGISFTNFSKKLKCILFIIQIFVFIKQLAFLKHLVWKLFLKFTYIRVNFNNNLHAQRSQKRKKYSQVVGLFCAFGICACKSCSCNVCEIDYRSRWRDGFFGNEFFGRHGDKLRRR